jgi:hypothetical protein
MLYRLAAYIQASFTRRARGIVAALQAERGQGTVEYVGLILLVSHGERHHLPLSTSGCEHRRPPRSPTSCGRGERAAVT